VPVYYNEVSVDLPLQMPQAGWSGSKTIIGDIQYQGCSDELCYKMMHVPLKAGFVSEAEGQTLSNNSNQSVKTDGFFGRLSELLGHPDFVKLGHGGFWLALLIAFLGGVLTDFTPCVWPMIPITLAIIGVRKDRSLSDNLKSVLILQLGIAVMFSGLGILAAGLGYSLGFLFQNLFFLIVLEVILILMGLSLLGLFQFQLPPAFQAWISKISASGFRGIFLVGLSLGLLATPCVGPVVGPILLFVASTKDIFLGFILLLSYAMGMGILFSTGRFYLYA